MLRPSSRGRREGSENQNVRLRSEFLNEPPRKDAPAFLWIELDQGRVVRARNSLRAQDETAYSFLSQEPARKIYSREGRASFVSDEERSRLKEGLCHQQTR